MTYPQTLKYLESFINYEKILTWSYKESLKLARIKEFLKTIGNPQERLRAILHVAGSKGKGSTCAFLTYILREAGFRVGLYTSPHLSDFKERIRILSAKPSQAQGPKADFAGMISKNELSDLVTKLKPHIEKYNKNSKYGPLSFFEVYTVLALFYFKEKKVDFAVLETGLGGRLDATNVVNPLICGITPLSYEHTEKLGRTLKEIAAEKAGIIKSQKSTVVSAPQEKEAMEVIREKCKKTGSRLYTVGKDLTYQKCGSGFKIKGLLGEYKNLKTHLLGEHQLLNATLAVGMIEALTSYGIKVSNGSIRSGLWHTRWPARCEVMRKRPFVVLDGAQNLASVEALKKVIQEKFRYKKLVLVLGISCDKDILGICAELRDFADTIILTCANNPRATPLEILAQYFPQEKTRLTLNVKEARELASRLAGKKDLVLVTGSLFVVGEFRCLEKA